MSALRLGPALKPWTREQESRECEHCKAKAGRQCVTASGSAAARCHAGRFAEAVAASRTCCKSGAVLMRWRD